MSHKRLLHFDPKDYMEFGIVHKESMGRIFMAAFHFAEQVARLRWGGQRRQVAANDAPGPITREDG